MFPLWPLGGAGEEAWCTQGGGEVGEGGGRWGQGGYSLVLLLCPVTGRCRRRFCVRKARRCSLKDYYH